jgi:glyceraldehyde 3-phosphate dehydrogenase
MKIVINGFGRIGRTFLRTILQDEKARKKLEVVAINIGPENIEFTAHLFKYDTTMGTFTGSVTLKDNTLIIDDVRIKIIAERDPAACKWESLGVDWVVDASGKFTHREQAALHLQAGAQHVLITAPAHDDDMSIIPGINHNLFDGKKHKIVSLGSCTTNAFMPMLKVLDDAFSITHGFMTTIHAYTNSQVLLDVQAKSLRLSRAAALNIIPTSTGASSMIGKVLPQLAKIVTASSLRVPVGKVSLIDLTVQTKKELSVDQVNHAFIAAKKGPLKGFLDVTDEELVSSDFSGNNHSVIIDSKLTMIIGSNAKVFGWYDNEWGYSQRLKDFLLMI